ncbi:MAG: BrnA antitoxin family protein [Geminicoccaceae bacterium]
MSDREKPRPLPKFRTDEEAEQFVDKADLTQYDLSADKVMRFEFEKNSRQVNLRMRESLVQAIKAKASARGIPYQRFIREALEKALA